MEVKDTIQADLNKHFSRYEDPLWDEEHPVDNVFEIKIATSKKTTVWKLLQNKKVILAINKTDLPNNIAEKLSTGDGLQNLLKLFKQHKEQITLKIISKAFKE